MKHEIALSGSQIFFVCLVGVWQRDFEPVVCVPGATSWELPYYSSSTVVPLISFYLF